MPNMIRNQNIQEINIRVFKWKRNLSRPITKQKGLLLVNVSIDFKDTWSPYLLNNGYIQIKDLTSVQSNNFYHCRYVAAQAFAKIANLEKFPTDDLYQLVPWFGVYISNCFQIQSNPEPVEIDYEDVVIIVADIHIGNARIDFDYMASSEEIEVAIRQFGILEGLDSLGEVLAVNGFEKVLPTIKLKAVDDEESKKLEDSSCSICLDDYREGAITLRTSCSHIFHEECLLGWLSKHISCPYCRSLC